MTSTVIIKTYTDNYQTLNEYFFKEYVEKHGT
jgi:hypothetical protein